MEAGKILLILVVLQCVLFTSSGKKLPVDDINWDFSFNDYYYGLDEKLFTKRHHSDGKLAT